MNIYLEKIAGLVKRAFDSDYDEGDEYGIASNRSIGNNMVHDMLLKASKDPNVHVTVDDVSSWHAPEVFKEKMAEVRGAIGPKKSNEQHIKDNTMDWHRDYVWSMGMKKSNPILKKYINKDDSWGSEEEDQTNAILDHLTKVYNY